MNPLEALFIQNPKRPDEPKRPITFAATINKMYNDKNKSR